MLHVFIWSSLVVRFVQASICLCKEKGSDLYPVPVVPELLHERRLREKDGISLCGVAGEVRGQTQTLRCRFLDFTGRVYVTLYSARETVTLWRFASGWWHVPSQPLLAFDQPCAVSI